MNLLSSPKPTEAAIIKDVVFGELYSKQRKFCKNENKLHCIGAVAEEDWSDGATVAKVFVRVWK